MVADGEILNLKREHTSKLFIRKTLRQFRTETAQAGTCFGNVGGLGRERA